MDLYPSFQAILRDAEEARVRVLAVTTTPRAYAGNIERASHAPFVSIGLGLHPQIVGTAHADMALFRNILPTAAFVGEVGLDASPQFYRTLDEQESIFHDIVRATADAGGRPMTVHGVRAFRRVLSIIENEDTTLINRYALHWFSGTVADARRGLGLNCFFSINEAMIRVPRGREIIAMLPRGAVLTETDGPFIKRKDVAIRPSMVDHVVRWCAERWGVEPEYAARQINENFDRFAVSS